MVDVLVLADDFTGANDAGAQCARLGVRSVVTADMDLGPEQLPDDTRVVVIDTESRHDSPAQAREKVAGVVRRFRRGGVPRIFKKTDSTLRGNIGAELEAVVNAGPVRRVMFVPAYPAAGRTTIDGYHYVDGVAVHESPYARDPRAPVRESFVPALLAQQTNLRVEHGGPDNLSTVLERMQPGILVVDASAPEDVRAIASAAHARHDLAFAGPVGVLAELLPRWRLTAQPPPPTGTGPLLLVNGSLNDVSLRQCAWARDHGFVSVKIPAEAGTHTDSREAVAARAAEELRAGRDVVVFTIESASELLGGVTFGDGLSAPELTADVVAQALGDLTGRTRIALCIFGGETSHAVLRRIGCTTVYPCAYLGDGLSGALVRAGGSVAVVVTKSGGFGPDNVAGIVRDWVRGAGETRKE